MRHYQMDDPISAQNFALQIPNMTMKNAQKLIEQKRHTMPKDLYQLAMLLFLCALKEIKFDSPKSLVNIDPIPCKSCFKIYELCSSKYAAVEIDDIFHYRGV